MKSTVNSVDSSIAALERSAGNDKQTEKVWFFLLFVEIFLHDIFFYRNEILFLLQSYGSSYGVFMTSYYLEQLVHCPPKYGWVGLSGIQNTLMQASYQIKQRGTCSDSEASSHFHLKVSAFEFVSNSGIFFLTLHIQEHNCHWKLVAKQPPLFLAGCYLLNMIIRPEIQREENLITF